MLTLTSSSPCATDDLLDTMLETGGATRAESHHTAVLRQRYRLQRPVVICTECGQEIPASRGACPVCTRPQTGLLQNVQVLVAAVVAMAFLAKVFVMLLS